MCADHNSRAVAQIALVDEMERVLCNLYVRPEAPVVSYLTPLTGLTAQLLAQHGMPLAQAMAVLLQCLPRNAILVGQNIAKDVQWLGLKEGQHFEQASLRGGGNGAERAIMSSPWATRTAGGIADDCLFGIVPTPPAPSHPPSHPRVPMCAARR